MEKTVIFRDRQEFQAADPNALQGYVRGSLDHLVADAVSDQKHYAGFATAATGNTEVTVQPGRYFNGGAVYVGEQEQALNLFQYVPLVTNRIVAVVVWGQEVDTQVEPRDFLVDLQTGATEPQAVAMERARHAEVNPLAGTESADPQPPVLQSGTLAVAYVYLTPAGIERVEMQTASQVPNGFDQRQRLAVLESWQAAAEPRIESIATDLVALAKRSASKVDKAVFMELAGDVATVKNRLQLPASYASYDADAFTDATKQNAAHAGYSARVDNGLHFPFASVANLPLALFNPLEPGILAPIAEEASNMRIPVHNHVPRVATSGYAGDLSLSQYQSQTFTTRDLVEQAWRWDYGFNLNDYRLWYGWNSPTPNWNRPWPGYWYRGPAELYAPVETTEAVTGTLLAQTFITPNAGWTMSFKLYFTAIGTSGGSPAGDVQVLLCKTVGGKPDLSQVLTRATRQASALQLYPNPTTFISKHVFLEGGERYALVVITTGSHRVAVVSGNDYTQGTLFYGSDGDYFQGDLTKDLMFEVWVSKFTHTRTEVQLQPLSLANGLTDISIDAPHLVPDGCELRYEIQPQGAGAWYAVGDAGMRLGNDATAPSLVNLRVVLLGTQDVQPAFSLTTGAIRVSRPDLAFTAWSTARTLGAATTGVTLKLLIADWDAVNHTITPKIVTGGSTETAASTTVTTDQNGATLKTYTFTIPASSSYEIKLSGTRTSGSKPFVVLNRIDIAA